ncbi:MAG: ribosomal-processing cysteine protease Prp [Spirochaetales bacterium]|nr:ribosomal-processing cysteine protease Prp [Spirochaetales bacterium]
MPLSRIHRLISGFEGAYTLINVSIQLSKEDCLTSLKAEGHARQEKRGLDIVCAAVSTLLRTMARLLQEENGIAVDGSADREGEMELRVSEVPREKKEKIKGMTGFLLKGLLDLKSDFPQNINITINKEWEE